MIPTVCRQHSKLLIGSDKTESETCAADMQIIRKLKESWISEKESWMKEKEELLATIKGLRTNVQ